MANAAVNITIGTSLADGTYSPSVKGASAPVLTSLTTVNTDATTVADNVATLVADGASPTQAHVTTLNTNWGTLVTDLALATTAASTQATAINGDVTVMWNASTITHRNQMRAALRAALLAIEGGYGGLAE
jgi:hypothetical protein